MLSCQHSLHVAIVRRTSLITYSNLQWHLHRLLATVIYFLTLPDDAVDRRKLGVKQITIHKKWQRPH